VCLTPKDRTVEVTFVAEPFNELETSKVIEVECSAGQPGASDAKRFSTSEIVPGTFANTLSVRELENGVPVRIWCLAYSEAGHSDISALSQEITPGVSLITTIQLHSVPDGLEPETLRKEIADHLVIPSSKVVIDGTAQEEDAESKHQCHSDQAAGSPVFTFKVMMQGNSDPNVTKVISKIAAMADSPKFAKSMEAARVNIVERPALVSPDFIDSSLKTLQILPRGNASSDPGSLVPAFRSDIFKYELNVTSLQYTLIAVANSSLALPVEIDLYKSSPANFEVKDVAPESRLILVTVISRDLTSSNYYIRVFFQPVPCSPACSNDGECDGMTGTCKCTDGYHGDTCEAYCPGKPEACNGYGRCGASSCECQDTFTGEDCGTRICPTCQNGGECKPGDSTLESWWGCSCTESWKGARCQDRRCPNDCSSAGTCDGSTGKCTCYIGYTGSDCGTRPQFKTPLSNAVDLQLFWGIKGFSEKNTSKPEYEGGFNFHSAVTQTWMVNVVDRAREDPDLKVRTELISFPEALKTMALSEGYDYPFTNSEILSTLLSRLPYQFVKMYGTDLGTDDFMHRGNILYVRAKLKVDLEMDAAPKDLKVVYDFWEEFVEKMNDNAPSGAKMLMVSKSWTRMETELDTVTSTVEAFVASILFTLATVLIFTGNVLLSIYTVVTILLTVMTLFGYLVFVLRWEFGAIQAVGVIFFVGLSVDYCLHMAHAYNESQGKDRRQKSLEAITHLGTAMLGGMLTTVGSVAFLFPCWIHLFYQLGMMIFANMLIAFCYTFLFLVPLLMIAGPTGNCGSIYYLLFCRACRPPPPPGSSPHGDTNADMGMGGDDVRTVDSGGLGLLAIPAAVRPNDKLTDPTVVKAATVGRPAPGSSGETPRSEAGPTPVEPAATTLATAAAASSASSASTPRMCSVGCGRRAAGEYDTCCRSCVSSGGRDHGYICNKNFQKYQSGGTPRDLESGRSRADGAPTETITV